MRQIDRCQLDMLIRVRAFGVSHGQLFPTTNPAHAAFATIAGEVERLEALDVAERSATQTARVTRKEVIRGTLVKTLARAGATARVLTKRHSGLDAQVDVPLPADGRMLLTVARQFAARAAPWAEAFAAHGIPIAEIEERIAAFEQGLQEHGTGRDNRVKARAEIAASFARAMDAVGVLDVTVANCLATDPVVLAVWTHDRRIVYPRRQRQAAFTEPAPEPAGQGPAAVDLAPVIPA